MEVEFHRTGERRYSVVILRDNLPKLEMNPAPGFDSLMPHDLLHFLVEQEFGLRQAIFGQVASGGGTFRQRPSESKNTRNDSRERRKLKQKGGKMLQKEGMNEYFQSERATYICWQDWLAHSNNPALQNQAKEMKETAQSIFGQMDKAEHAKFNPENLDKIRRRIDEISQQWSNLKVGESMSLKW
jgi:hypothetical protein